MKQALFSLKMEIDIILIVIFLLICLGLGYLFVQEYKDVVELQNYDPPQEVIDLCKYEGVGCECLDGGFAPLRCLDLYPEEESK